MMVWAVRLIWYLTLSQRTKINQFVIDGSDNSGFDQTTMATYSICNTPDTFVAHKWFSHVRGCYSAAISFYLAFAIVQPGHSHKAFCLKQCIFVAAATNDLHRRNKKLSYRKDSTRRVT